MVKRRKVLSTISVILIMSLLLLTACGSSSSNKSATDAKICAEKAVSDNLKSPSTAKFCKYTEMTATNLGGDRWEVTGYVDAQNSFGAVIRTSWTVMLTLTKTGFTDSSVQISDSNASEGAGSTTNSTSDIEASIPSDATITIGKQLSEQETIDKMVDFLALLSESLSAYIKATENIDTHTLSDEEISQIEEQIGSIAENINDKISVMEFWYIPSSYFTSSWNKLIDCLIETSNIFKDMSVWDVNGDGIVTGEEATSVLRDGAQRLLELNPRLDDVVTTLQDEINDNPNLQEETSQNKSSATSPKPFTNKYGTSTTICAHTGCTNYIASSGDTNCCTTHSHKCADCGCYIDEDALYCISCIAKSLDKASNSKSSSEHICQATGCSKDGTCTITGISGQTEYYCYEHYAQMLSWMDMFSGK